MSVTRTVRKGFLNSTKADMEFAQDRIAFHRHLGWLNHVLADSRMTIADREAKKAKVAQLTAKVEQMWASMRTTQAPPPGRK
jgi:hypothetical protein